MPMIKAPWHWLSAVLRFTTSPQSCTATIFLTFTIPVSGSTSTSAICTPPTPLLVRSGGLSLSGFLPRTVTCIAPSFEQACFQLSDLLESPLTRTVPFTHSNRSGCALSAGATLANSASRVSTAARRVEELTPPIVVEPPEPPERRELV